MYGLVFNQFTFPSLQQQQAGPGWGRQLELNLGLLGTRPSRLPPRVCACRNIERKRSKNANQAVWFGLWSPQKNPHLLSQITPPICQVKKVKQTNKKDILGWLKIFCMLSCSLVVVVRKTWITCCSRWLGLRPPSPQGSVSLVQSTESLQVSSNSVNPEILGVSKYSWQNPPWFAVKDFHF